MSLPFKVEARRASVPFFEAIAAFDILSVAIAYAVQCANDNPSGIYYRVVGAKKIFYAYMPNDDA